MDLGVGSFVFSQGVVSAIPLIKDPSHLTAPLKPKLVAVLRKTFPIILLGFVRVLLVKSTEYPVSFYLRRFQWDSIILKTLFTGARVGVWHPLEFFPHARIVTHIAGLAASIHYTYSDFICRVASGFMYAISYHYTFDIWTYPWILICFFSTSASNRFIVFRIRTIRFEFSTNKSIQC